MGIYLSHPPAEAQRAPVVQMCTLIHLKSAFLHILYTQPRTAMKQSVCHSDLLMINVLVSSWTPAISADCRSEPVKERKLLKRNLTETKQMEVSKQNTCEQNRKATTCKATCLYNTILITESTWIGNEVDTDIVLPLQLSSPFEFWPRKCRY